MSRGHQAHENCTTTRDGECVLRIAGVTGSPTGGGRTVGGDAEMPISYRLVLPILQGLEYSYSNMMH